MFQGKMKTTLSNNEYDLIYSKCACIRSITKWAFKRSAWEILIRRVFFQAQWPGYISGFTGEYRNINYNCRIYTSTILLLKIDCPGLNTKN